MRSSRPATLLLIAPALICLAAACGGGDNEPLTFPSGVASGDARPDGAVLWTRTDREATLTAQVATDQAFQQITTEQEVEAADAAGFTAKVSITGLDPGTQYYYRFREGDALSDAGVFHTAPLSDDAAPVRFIFSGDADATVKEDGTREFDFRVLDTMREENADFFLFFGDTIYADSGFGVKAETLEAYRAKYQEARAVEPLRAILGATSVYTIWDDHEVENDFAGTTVDPALLAAGRQAFREYMPISGDETPEVLYRRFRWGAIELIILDERSFRDDDVAAACTLPGEEDPDLLPGLGLPGATEAFHNFRRAVALPPETGPACVDALNDPQRTMLGADQKQFLFQALQESTAAFTFIVNEVPITELVGLPYDRWEGYRAERQEILRFLEEEKIDNVIFLTTDFHANIISDVRRTFDDEPAAVEAIAGPIAHQTLADSIAASQGEDLVRSYEILLRQVPRVDCTAFDAFSYGLVEVDGDSAVITLKDEDGNELCRRVIGGG